MEKFELTEDHLTLLSEMEFLSEDVCGFGSVTTDCKRPYGNSNIVRDVAELLGIDLPDYDDDEYGEVAREVREIHRETATALQIIIDCKTFETGTYVSKKWSGYGERPKWKRKV